ncbi:unnamed protein product, partial [Prorocentrum cordatum]
GDKKARNMHLGKVKDMGFNKKQAGLINALLKQVLLATQMVRDLWAVKRDSAWVEVQPGELYNIRRLFRVIKCFDPPTRKVNIMMREVPMDQPSLESDEQPLPSPTLVRSLLQRALAEVGARWALGAAPRGAMEDIVQNAVDGQ